METRGLLFRKIRKLFNEGLQTEKKGECDMNHYRKTKNFEILYDFMCSDKLTRVYEYASEEEAARVANSLQGSIHWYKIQNVYVVKKKDVIILLNLCGL